MRLRLMLIALNLIEKYYRRKYIEFRKELDKVDETTDEFTLNELRADSFGLLNKYIYLYMTYYDLEYNKDIRIKCLLTKRIIENLYKISNTKPLGMLSNLDYTFYRNK